MQSSLQILQQYWKHNSFRGRQEEIINSILEKKDTLALLPTGGGKSLCFQIPALMMDGMCLVITPLIALMKDQVYNLSKKNIPALLIHSGMNFYEVRKTLQDAASGRFKFLYLSPERLETNLFKEYLPSLNINLIAVDEAHCVSQWGYDFRPPYLRIHKLKEELPNVPVLALTASATALVQKDIVQKLELHSLNILKQSFERKNISYSVFKVDSKINKLVEILRNVSGAGIVYCRNRRLTKEVAELLTMQNISVDFYHAGLLQEERSLKQENWMHNKTRVIVCTNAFGMGIDKADVRTVIHYDVPDCIENYYQEAGRAGRDEKKAYAVLLCQTKDMNELKGLSAKRFPLIEEIRKVYQHLADHLEIPVGIGEGNFYDFDLNTFAKNFQLDATLVTNVLKALELEGYIHFSENIFLPSQGKFIVEKFLLNDFENNHPELEPLIKCLLRTYESILDNRVSINEKQIAKLLKCSADKVRQGLKELKAFNIIEYLPQKETPQIQFFTNRASAKFLSIDHENYFKRKELFELRVSGMLDYLQLENECRSVFIANYFDDETIKDCGVCDNCLNKKKKNLSDKNYKKIEEKIFDLINKQQLSIKELIHFLKDEKQDEVWKTIEHLQSERKIKVDDEGIVSKK